MKKFEKTDVLYNTIKANPKRKFFCYNGKIYNENTIHTSSLMNDFLPDPVIYVPEIVSDGLVVHLDAADTDSYSGAGSTWYDLTTNNADFILENSPTYNTDFGGYFEFNGSDQALSSPSVAGVTDFDNTDDYTIEIWLNADSIQPDVTSNYVAIVEKWDSNSSTQYPYALRYHVTNGNFMLQVYDGTTARVAYASELTEQWIQCVGVYDWTNTTLYFYVNGQLSTHPWGGFRDISTVVNSVSNNLSATIAKRASPTSGYFLAGDVAIFRIYNKALSSDEVLQNYNANKNRF